MSYWKFIRVFTIFASLTLFILGTANAQIGTWTWQAGSNTAAALGNYTAPGAVPGARQGAANWTDANGNLWLFGGQDDTGFLNDLWEFTPSNNTWIYVGGSSGYNQSGTYGTQGQAGSGNIPGARFEDAFTVDTQGNFWLYGGYGIDSVGNTGYLGDLWEYNVTSGNWTWWGGSTAINPDATYGALGAGSTTFQPAGAESPALSIDNSGNVWIFGGYTFSGYTNAVWELTPSNLYWTWQSGSVTSFFLPPVYTGTPNPGSVYNTNFWTDSSGNLWIFGGTYLSIQESNELWEFNVSTKTWAFQNPTTYTNGMGVYGTPSTPNAANIPGGRYAAASAVDDSGNLWLFGGFGYNTLPYEGYLNDLLSINSNTLDWTWWSGSNNSYYLSGVYGTLNVADANNYPGSRYGSNLWADKNGNIWLFGGTGFDSNGDLDNLNDLWIYNHHPFANNPVIAPGSESINDPVVVTITDSTPNSTIYYTTDGSTPISSPTTLTYSGQFTIFSSATVNAIAVASGYANSSVVSATYNIGPYYFWQPTTTTFSYGNSLGSVPGLLTFTSNVPGTWAYFIHGNPVNASTVLTVGKYQLDAIFTPTGGGYQPKISYIITVAPAVLTVTPNPVIVTYGSPVVKYTYTITGYVNGEGPSVVTGTPTINANATVRATSTGAVVYTSNFGRYMINATWGSLKATNYTFAFVGGPLAINPCTCSLTVIPYDDVITQGTPIPSSFAYKVTGFLNWDNAANQLSGTAATSTNATSSSGHGYYTIYSAPGSLMQLHGNYASINYGTATLTIH